MLLIGSRITGMLAARRGSKLSVTPQSKLIDEEFTVHRVQIILFELLLTWTDPSALLM
jgi:hypothetical protein